jgi:Tfp pilus assembly protein PilF
MIGDPVSSLAHYGLARSFVLSGETTKAREEFKQALDTWKDADPDLPIPGKLRADYASVP